MTTDIILGKNQKGEKIFGDNKAHTLIFAPYGSGKGLSFFLPSLLKCENSMIIHDIDLDNHKLTANHRKSMGNEVFLFNPLGKKTHCYNPLGHLSNIKEQQISEIKKIINLLICDNNKHDFDSKNLLTVLILSLLESEHKEVVSFGHVNRMLHGNIQNEMTRFVAKLRDSHSLSYHMAKAFLDKTIEEQNVIIRALGKHLEPWNDPLVDYATSKSDFKLTDFHNKKITLFIGVEANNMQILQPFMRFFYKHLMDKLISSETNKHRVTLLLDEFCSLGKLDNLTYNLPYFRKYNIDVILFAHEIYQIEKIYCTDFEDLVTICNRKIVLHKCDEYTAKYISNITIDKDGKELFSWEKIYKLPKELIMILNGNDDPIICNRFMFNEDKEMKNMIKLN